MRAAFRPQEGKGGGRFRRCAGCWRGCDEPLRITVLASGGSQLATEDGTVSDGGRWERHFFAESHEPKRSDPPQSSGRDIGLREATEMVTKRAVRAPIPHLRWALLVPLVLFGNVVLASLAWWLVELILK
jgi:hypothetical protein